MGMAIGQMRKIGHRTNVEICRVKARRIMWWGSSGSDSNNKKGVPLNFFDWGSYQILGTARSGTVFRAVLNRKMVALKLCDLWQNPQIEAKLTNEVCVYNSLRSLQGIFIPKLRAAGYTAAGFFIIATDIARMPIEDAGFLSAQACQVIQQAIHHQDFIHGDIRLKYSSQRQWCANIIDFAFAGSEFSVSSLGAKHGQRTEFKNQYLQVPSRYSSHYHQRCCHYYRRRCCGF